MMRARGWRWGLWWWVVGWGWEEHTKTDVLVFQPACII